MRLPFWPLVLSASNDGQTYFPSDLGAPYFISLTGKCIERLTSIFCSANHLKQVGRIIHSLQSLKNWINIHFTNIRGITVNLPLPEMPQVEFSSSYFRLPEPNSLLLVLTVAAIFKVWLK
jgi:hypothetical protein